MHFHNGYTQEPLPWGHEIYTFGRTSIAHHFYITLTLSDLCLGVEEKVLKKKDAFSLYTLYGHVLAQGPLYQGS